jgi:hypothetical protein
MMPPSSCWRRALARKLKRWAEDRFPCTFPVRVCVRPAKKMPDTLGYFLLNDDADRGVIALRDSLDRDALVETFAEEWAHARTAFLCDEEDLDTDDPFHHPSFWAEYGRIVKACRERTW